MTATLGCLGTGRMGTAMAGRLLDAGRPVTVWNRTAAKTAPLAARGARAAASVADLGACDVVFVTVTGSADLAQVTVGDGGLLSQDSRPAILVDCSTVSQEASAQVRAAASAAGMAFLAAPGSSCQARRRCSLRSGRTWSGSRGPWCMWASRSRPGW